MKIPIYHVGKVPKKILKRFIPFSETNYPILQRFAQPDKVTYCGDPCTFVGIVAVQIAKPPTTVFGYALQSPNETVFIISDIWNVRKVGDA